MWWSNKSHGPLTQARSDFIMSVEPLGEVHFGSLLLKLTGLADRIYKKKSTYNPKKGDTFLTVNNCLDHRLDKYSLNFSTLFKYIIIKTKQNKKISRFIYLDLLRWINTFTLIYICTCIYSDKLMYGVGYIYMDLFGYRNAYWKHNICLSTSVD